jgi:hypothetical protein
MLFVDAGERDLVRVMSSERDSVSRDLASSVLERQPFFGEVAVEWLRAEYRVVLSWRLCAEPGR